MKAWLRFLVPRVVLAAAATTAGCASLEPDAGLGEVQKLVAGKAGTSCASRSMAARPDAGTSPQARIAP